MSSVYDALIKAGQNVLKERDLKLAEVEKARVELRPKQRELEDDRREIDLMIGKTITRRVPEGLSREGKIWIMIVGVGFLVIVNQLMASVLRTQMHESAVLMTINLSDAAASYVARKDILQLGTTVTKYARLSRVAYAIVMDSQGKVIAHSSATLPPKVQDGPTANQGPLVSHRELRLAGKSVYEIRAPILDGQLGYARIGIWADVVEKEIYQVLFRFIWPISLGLLAIIIAISLFTQFLARTMHGASTARFYRASGKK